jgi:RHS repeat-associated protein
MLTYHFDSRGSTVALSDANGNVTDQIEYSPYGTMTYRSGTNDTPFLYNGRYGVMTDPNGLLFMRARYYNPYLCRFINQDPSGFNGGLNFYAYANGNPVSLTDPFGLGALGDNVGSGSLLSSVNSIPSMQMTINPNVNTGPQMGAVGFTPAAPYYDPSQPTTLSVGFPSEQNLYSGLNTISAAMLGAEATGQALIQNLGPMLLSAGLSEVLMPEMIAAEGGTYSAIGSTGRVGEQWLADNLGGDSQVYFNTTQGGRYVDQLVGDVANESKVGYQSLTQSTQLQISKDAELLNNGTFQDVNWHFFRSPVTGLGGPSQPLLNALQQNGINFIIH